MRLVWMAGVVVSSLMIAQPRSAILPEQATQVSEHVHAIVGFPNIAIVVGTKATLVVDTGLGPRNGAIITRVAQKLAKGPLLYLATTHFHPEHAGGEAGFPPQTILVRNRAQQEEMRANGDMMLDRFRGRSEEWRQLLDGVKQREPDVLFDREAKLDLGGGVAVTLMWITGGHTRGDMMTFVEPDKTLISGDIVESKLVPTMLEGTSSVKGWLAILDEVEKLQPRFVVPDHGDLGDGSLVGKEKAFISDVRDAALALKKQGVSLDDAGKRVTETMKTKYSDWPNLANVSNVVRRVYAEY
jgi:glyoxylase-like metal-dependent hydrolase (beta-lactamase superfamily II)